ncbi:Os11g0585200, partial [Oryza sativa Japonica Group]
CHRLPLLPRRHPLVFSSARASPPPTPPRLLLLSSQAAAAAAAAGGGAVCDGRRRRLPRRRLLRRGLRWRGLRRCWRRLAGASAAGGSWQRAAKTQRRLSPPPFAGSPPPSSALPSSGGSGRPHARLRERSAAATSVVFQRLAGASSPSILASARWLFLAVGGEEDATSIIHGERRGGRRLRFLELCSCVH